MRPSGQSGLPNRSGGTHVCPGFGASVVAHRSVSCAVSEEVVHSVFVNFDTRCVYETGST